MEIKIHGAGHLHGDGMAIWLTEERAKPGNVFGHADNFNGLGVFIDTYKNSRPGVVFPYVMAMLGNSSVSYDSEQDGKNNELAGCSVGLSPRNAPRSLYSKRKSGPWYQRYRRDTQKDTNDLLPGHIAQS